MEAADFFDLPLAPIGHGFLSVLPAAVADQGTPYCRSSGHFGASGRKTKKIMQYITKCTEYIKTAYALLSSRLPLIRLDFLFIILFILVVC